MLHTKERFRLQDEDKKNTWYMDVNWDKDDDKPKDDDCAIIKVTHPGGEISFMKREHLNEILFAIGKPEDQMKLIPKTEAHVRWYETTLGIKAKRDIHKGEMINVPVKLSLPVEAEETIGKTTGSRIIKTI